MPGRRTKPETKRPSRTPKGAPPPASSVARSGSTGGSRFSRIYPAILVLAPLLTYANACNNPFVFDDVTSVVTNTNLRDLSSPAVFGGPVQSAVAGRPVVALSLAVNYALGTLNPWGYHAWNLVVHMLAGLLLFGVLRRTLSREQLPAQLRANAAGISFAAALVWLIHPLNSEVVNYVTQRTEAMMGLFYLLTLYSAIRAFGARAGRTAWPVMAVAACACGMGTKESMATAPLVVLLYDAVFVSGSLTRSLRAHTFLYAGLAATWIPLAILIAPGPRWRSAGFESGVTPWTYLLNQPPIILDYLKLAVWPHPLLLDYGHAKPVALVSVLPSFLVVSALCLATLLAWLRWPALAFVATAFWITLAPSSSILPIATEVGAERRMYLPLAAVLTLAALGLEWLRLRFAPGRQRPAAAVLAVVCAAFAWITFERNREYRSELGIWQTVLARRPTDRAHYNVGIVLSQQGRTSEALEHFRAAVEDEPRAHYALGFENEKSGRYEEAVGEYQAFLGRKPDDLQAPEAHIRLGVVLRKLERLDESYKALERAVQMRPRSADARFELANTLMASERYAEASDQYAELLRLSPDSALALENLGLSLVAQQRETDAIPPLERAVALQPKEGRTRLMLANALAAAGRLDDAIEQYRQGIALVPDSPTLHRNLAAALLRAGQPQEGLKSLEAALALQPDDEATRETYEELKRALFGGRK